MQQKTVQTTNLNLSTRVVNIRQQEYDVYIGRAGYGQDGYFGNPHVVGWCTGCEKSHNRAEAIKLFKEYFLYRIQNDPEFRRRVISLKGMRLGCFCHPLPCHGEVYKEWLDNFSAGVAE